MICIARAMAEQWGGILTEKDGGRTEKGHGSKRGMDQKGCSIWEIEIATCCGDGSGTGKGIEKGLLKRG